MIKDFGQVKDCEEATWILSELFPKKSFCGQEERWIHGNGDMTTTTRVFIFPDQFNVKEECTTIDGNTWTEVVGNVIRKIEGWENGQKEELQEAVPADICLEADGKVVE